MKKSTKCKLLSGLLSVVLLSGCGEKSDCELPTRHVHRYIKEINSEIVVDRYIDSEKLSYDGFNWTPEYIEINKNDEKLYKLITKKDLINGIDNFDYLYNIMANHHDYLMFYYEYYTTEVYTTTDEDGHVEMHTKRVRHDGWHSNPYDSDNTGDVRLYHHRYSGYRIVNKNGNFVIESSPLVDDIRYVLEDYPYFNDYCVHEVYEKFKFKRSELKNLSPEDFDVFEGPDLSKHGLTL